MSPVLPREERDAITIAWNGWIDDHRHLTSRTSDLSMAFEDGYRCALDAAKKENERLREAVLIEAADALVKFADDTYPRDIFVPPSRTDYDEINALLRRERGHMLDAIAADCYRRALALGASELRALAADEGERTGRCVVCRRQLTEDDTYWHHARLDVDVCDTCPKTNVCGEDITHHAMLWHVPTGADDE